MSSVQSLQMQHTIVNHVEYIQPEHSISEMLSLIRLMNHSKPRINDIVIGCQRSEESELTAMHFKRLWERYGGYDGGTVLDTIIWNPCSSSFKKYARKINSLNPDGFVVIDKTGAFLKLLERLHKEQKVTSEKTFLMPGVEDAVMTTSGRFVVDGLKGITYNEEGYVYQQYERLMIG